MQIRFSVDGGIAAFPGLAKPVTIDCAKLSSVDSAHLRDLVHRADFFARPIRGRPRERRMRARTRSRSTTARSAAER